MKYLAGLVLVVWAGNAAAEVPFPGLPPRAAMTVTASSTFKDKKDAYNPKLTVEYELRGELGPDAPPQVLWSAWCEGKPDEGIGETVTITFAEPTRVDTISIAAGVHRTKGLFAANNQITELEISADKKTQKLKPKGMDWAEATINAKVSTIAVKITAVKKGKMNDSCISGIDLKVGEHRIIPALGMDAKALAALPGAMQAMQVALDAPGKKGLEPLLVFPFTYASMSGYRENGNAKAVTTASWKVLAAACAKYEKASAKDPDNFVDPGGCPSSPNFDSNDDRPGDLTILSPTHVRFEFQSHNEYVESWDLEWKAGAWKLASVGASLR
ncbi:MAG: hypothetical protein ABI867_08495 [Kofleriaceae bacterium]